MNEASRCYLAEMIATFALTFIGAGAILISTITGGDAFGLLGIAAAHGIILSIGVSATMNISGAHVNPAVTVVMLVTGRIQLPRAIGYILAQLVGASIAGFLLYIIFNSLGPKGAEAMTACGLGTPAINVKLGVTPGMAVIIEMALTFLLIFAIFGTAVDPRAPKIGGFGIGLTVFADILVGGPLTGAAMNPARTFGTLIGGMNHTSNLWSEHWVYWVGPIAGAILGGLLYDKLILDKNAKS